MTAAGLCAATPPGAAFYSVPAGWGAGATTAPAAATAVCLPGFPDPLGRDR